MQGRTALSAISVVSLLNDKQVLSSASQTSSATNCWDPALCIFSPCLSLKTQKHIPTDWLTPPSKHSLSMAQFTNPNQIQYLWPPDPMKREERKQEKSSSALRIVPRGRTWSSTPFLRLERNLSFANSHEMWYQILSQSQPGFSLSSHSSLSPKWQSCYHSFSILLLGTSWDRGKLFPN